MIQDTKIEFCVIAAYDDGNKYCIAKFMHEEAARSYRRSRKRQDYVEYQLYRRFQKYDGEVIWEELS